MWKILIVDDSNDYVQSQIELAGNMDINLVHYDNWEDAQKVLESSGDQFACIIIDGKGKLKTGSKEEDIKHLNKALSWLKEQKGRGIYFYYVINTAYADHINELVDDEPVYGKFGEEKKMFQDILNNIENSGTQKIKVKYSDIFEIFDKKMLDSATENLLMKAIQDCDKAKMEDIKGVLTNIRAVQEAIYNSLRGAKIGIVPAQITKHGEIKKHLDGNLDQKNGYKPTSEVYQNSSISSIGNNIYWVTGQYIHNLEKETYFISHYTVKALLFSLFELLLWYKSIAIKYLKK